MAPPAAPRVEDVLRASVERLAQLLPASWRREVEYDVLLGERRADALLTVTEPDDGQRATFVVEARSRLGASDVPATLEQAASIAKALDDNSAQPLIVARYLSPPVREWLEGRDVSYADATGNVWVRLDRPALFLRDVGAKGDPWRGPGRPRGSLRDETAALLVRSLADFRPPYSVPELAKHAGVSVGAAYRMCDFLEEEALIERASPDLARKGPIVDVSWRPLLERWASESRDSAPTFRRFLAAKGLEMLRETLRGLTGSTEYVVTGSLAAADYAPAAPAALAVIYTRDVSGLAQSLGLREVERGANVWLGVPLGGAAFERSREIDGIRVAAPSQVAADLINGPGRAPAEAAALLDWMEANERAWRR